jgi:hypothetical protein
VQLRFFFIFAIFFLPLGAKAQRAEVFGIGGFLGIGRSTNSADFTTLPGIPSESGQPNTPYSDGNFFGDFTNNLVFRGGVFFNVPFLKDFNFRPALGLEYITSEIEAENNTITIVNGTRTDLVITHSVNSSFTSIPVSLSFFYDLFGAIPIGISTEAAYVRSAKYRKTRRITQPAEIEFLDGGNARTDFEGNLAGKNSVRFGIGGIIQIPQLSINLIPKFPIVPEISYSYTLSDVAAGVPWRVSQVYLTFVGKYSILSSKEFLKDTIILRDTTLQLAVFKATDTTILLKTDFRDSTTEDENYIYTTTFKKEFYTHFTPKPAPLLLADMRVRFLKGGVETEAVSLFLEDSVVRRTIVTPEETRIEFDTVHFTEFPHVIFYPEVTSESGVASWKIDITQQGKLLKTFHGDGEPGSSVNWNIALEADPVRIAQQPIDYAFSVTDREGQTSEMQRGKITFELQKKVNLPNAQLPVIREEFYFSKTLSAQAASPAFKKRVLKTTGAQIIVSTEEEFAGARTLAGMLKISDKNMAAGEIPARFKNMIAVYLYR